MKKITLTLLLIVSVLNSSCVGDAKETTQDGDFEIEFLFEKNGCKMYRFEDGGRYIYWSDCRGETQYSYQTKNNTYHKQSITSKNN